MDKVEQYRLFQEWIEKLEGVDNLTEWESNFVTSIKDQLNKKGSLSVRQAEILEKIYAEKTP